MLDLLKLYVQDRWPLELISMLREEELKEKYGERSGVEGGFKYAWSRRCLSAMFSQ